VHALIDPWRLNALLEDDGPLAGRFRLERDLGQDAIGARFAVLDHGCGRSAILRVLAAPSTALAEAACDVFQEVSVGHPKVAPQLAYGTSDELVYVVYKRVAGQRLTSLLAQRGELSVREVVPIASQLLMPLCALHARGRGIGEVAMRDIVLRRQSGRAYLVQLEDFGVHAASHVIRGIERSPAHDVKMLGALLTTLLEQLPASDEACEGLHTIAQECQGIVGTPPFDSNALMERLIDRLPPALFRLPLGDDPETERRSTGSLTAIPMVAVADEVPKVRRRFGTHRQTRGWLVAAIAVLGAVGLLAQVSRAHVAPEGLRAPLARPLPAASPIRVFGPSAAVAMWLPRLAPAELAPAEPLANPTAAQDLAGELESRRADTQPRKHVRNKRSRSSRKPTRHATTPEADGHRPSVGTLLPPSSPSPAEHRPNRGSRPSTSLLQPSASRG